MSLWQIRSASLLRRTGRTDNSNRGGISSSLFLSALVGSVGKARPGRSFATSRNKLAGYPTLFVLSDQVHPTFHSGCLRYGFGHLLASAIEEESRDRITA